MWIYAYVEKKTSIKKYFRILKHFSSRLIHNFFWTTLYLCDFVNWFCLSIYSTKRALVKTKYIHIFFCESHLRRGEMFKRNDVSTNRFKWGNFGQFPRIYFSLHLELYFRSNNFKKLILLTKSLFSWVLLTLISDSFFLNL